MALENTRNGLDAVITNRVRVGKFSILPNQASNVSNNLKNQLVIIPSTNIPTFGSYFTIDIRDKNQVIHNATIQFNVSPISGRTGDAENTTRFAPASFWLQKIEVVINNVTVDTYYDVEQFLKQQLFFGDEDRIYLNNLTGSYSGASSRYTKALSTTNYYIPLSTILDQCHLAVLNNASQIQLRVYTKPLANIITLGAGTGTAVATINYCNLLCKVTKLDSDSANKRLSMMSRIQEDNVFHKISYGVFQLSSGVSNASVVLTSIVGKVSWLFFVIRPTNALTGDNMFKFTQIKDFALLDSTSTNIVGGQNISHDVMTQLLAPYWFKSTYLTENATSVNALGNVVDNGANAYCWSFGTSPNDAWDAGRLLGSHQFSGNEQLLLNFNSALASACQLEVFAYVESIYSQGYDTAKVEQL